MKEHKRQIVLLITTLFFLKINIYSHKPPWEFDEVGTMGICPTEAIVGNSRIIAGFTKEGRMCSLYFPHVGCYNHIPYFTKTPANNENKNKKYYGAEKHQGCFAGIRVEGETNIKWLMDAQIEEFKYKSTSAPILGITYNVDNEWRIYETIYVPFKNSKYLNNVDAIVLKFEIHNISGKDKKLDFIYYASMNLNSSNQDPPILNLQQLGIPIDWNMHIPKPREWSFEKNVIKVKSDGIVWIAPSSSLYCRITGEVSKDPFNVPVEVRGNSFAIKPSLFKDFNLVESILQQKEIRKVNDEFENLPPLFGGLWVTLCWNLGEIKNGSSKTITIYYGLGRDEWTAENNIEKAKSISSEHVETEWSGWLNRATPYEPPAEDPEDVREKKKELYNRCLFTMKMLVDEKTGGIIASPNLQPKYYGVWPRDGVFQAVTWIYAGYPEIAEEFFNWLFRHVREDENGNYFWGQVYDVNGEYVGIPGDIIKTLFEYIKFTIPLEMSWFIETSKKTITEELIERDQMGEVLWGLGIFYDKNGGKLPSGVSEASVDKVVEYIKSKIVQGDIKNFEPEKGKKMPGLLEPSLDWYESPVLFDSEFHGIAQSLITNSAVYAGLMEYKKYGKYNVDDTIEVIKKSILDENGLWGSGDIPYYVYAPITGERTNCDERSGMYIGWPFNVTSPTDTKVLNNYLYMERKFETNQNSGQYSGVFVPRYLLSVLYERLLINQFGISEIAIKGETINLKERNSKKINTLLSYLTKVGYVPEEIDFSKGEISGALTRPLGWSSAFMVLALLAEVNAITLPVIEEKKEEKYQPTGPAGISIIIDCSGSMAVNDPNYLRREAAKLIVDLAKKEDSISVFGFDDKLYNIWPELTQIVSFSTKAYIKQAIDIGVVTGGATSIGLGLQAGFNSLSEKNLQNSFVLLLTDGEQNTPPWAEDILPYYKEKGWPIHCIGLNLTAGKETLQKIAAETGGTVIANVTSASELPQVYSWLNTVARPLEEYVEHKKILMKTGDTKQISFPVDITMKDVTIVTHYGSKVHTKLITPEGKVITPYDLNDDIYFSSSTIYNLYLLDNPSIGEWKVDIYAEETDEDHPVVLEITSQSDLNFEIKPTGGIIGPYKIGEEISYPKIICKGTKFPEEMFVTLNINLNGEKYTETFKVYDDGKHTDNDSGDGIYASPIRLYFSGEVEVESVEITGYIDGIQFKRKVFIYGQPLYKMHLSNEYYGGFDLYSVVNFPNPFHAKTGTKFEYYLTQNANVKIKVYAPTGDLLKTIRINSGELGGKAGYNIVEWDGKNDNGEYLASGTYFYIITAENSEGEKKVARGKMAIKK